MNKAKKMITALAVAAALFLPAHAEAKKKKPAQKTHVSKTHKKESKKSSKHNTSHNMKAKKKVSSHKSPSRGYASASEYLKKGKKAKKHKKSKTQH